MKTYYGTLIGRSGNSIARILRGLDIDEGATGETTIIEVADRTAPDADVTVYVDARTSGGAAERAERVAEEFRGLESVGVVRSASVVT